MEFWIKVLSLLIPVIVIGVVILDKEMGEIVRLRLSTRDHPLNHGNKGE